jgi:hypothetical protein
MGDAMGGYSFSYVSNGKVLATEERQLPHDLDALDLARKLSSRAEVVVWTGERYVARVKKDDDPIDACDTNGG